MLERNLKCIGYKVLSLSLCLLSLMVKFHRHKRIQKGEVNPVGKSGSCHLLYGRAMATLDRRVES